MDLPTMSWRDADVSHDSDFLVSVACRFVLVGWSLLLFWFSLAFVDRCLIRLCWSRTRCGSDQLTLFGRAEEVGPMTKGCDCDGDLLSSMAMALLKTMALYCLLGVS